MTNEIIAASVNKDFESIKKVDEECRPLPVFFLYNKTFFVQLSMGMETVLVF